MKQFKSILLYIDTELDPAVLDRVVHIASVVGAKLTNVLGRIADHEITKLDELMPWSYAQT